MTSRLITTAAIQNGSAFKYVRVTNDEVSRSLSAIGSRNAPSVLSSFQWRAGPPARRAGRGAAGENNSPRPRPRQAGGGTNNGSRKSQSRDRPNATHPGGPGHPFPP